MDYIYQILLMAHEDCKTVHFYDCSYNELYSGNIIDSETEEFLNHISSKNPEVVSFGINQNSVSITIWWYC